MPSPQWAAFVGLTALLCAAFLALARLSQDHLSGDADPPTMTATPSGADPGVATGVPEVRVPPPSPVEELSTPALLANVAATQALFAVVLLGSAAVFAIPASAFGAESLLADLTGPPMAAGVALGVALWLASEAGSRVFDAAGLDHDESVRELLAPETLWGWVVLMCVVLPVIAGVEELVFRAAAIGAVAAGFDVSPWLLAVVSSAAFGLGHGAQGRTGMVVTGVLGLVLAVAFVLTGSFVTVFVAHYLVNALEFLIHEG